MSRVSSTSDFNQFSVLFRLFNPLGLDFLQEALLVLVQLLHVETDGSLSLCLGAIIRHRDGFGMSVLGGYAGDEQTGLLGIVDRVGEQTGNFLRRMESSTMRGDGIVPTPLSSCSARLRTSLHFS